MYDKPLNVLFPDLFKLCEKQNIPVQQVKCDIQLVSFTRWLVNDLQHDWLKILSYLNLINKSDCKDKVTWKFGKNGRFSVKSTYDAMTVNDSGLYNKRIWKSKVPSKIKIFLWLMLNNAILTKDNMVKRKWQGDPACYFCTHNESLSH